MICFANSKKVVKKAPAIVAGAFLCLLAGACAPQADTGSTGDTRWQPASDSTVIFNFAATAEKSASLYRLRRELDSNPENPEIAARFATSALKTYAQSGDPRMLGYAAGALAPWSDELSPPVRIWLLRGRLLQTEHRFAEAAKDMDRLFESHPDEIEALLLAADAWRRSGNWQASRSRCLQLSLAGRTELARLCAAELQLALGNPLLALKAASLVLAAEAAQMPPEVLAWGHAIRAEAAGAAGDNVAALQSWRQALQSGATPELALQLGYVDALITAQKHHEALRLLEDMPEADAVLLRQAIAAAKLQDKRLGKWQTELEVRFSDPAYTSDDSLHWRERALFELDVRNNPTLALQYAERNWQAQKGFEDAELLLRAADAAKNPAAATAVARWRAEAGGAS